MKMVNFFLMKIVNVMKWLTQGMLWFKIIKLLIFMWYRISSHSVSGRVNAWTNGWIFIKQGCRENAWEFGIELIVIYW